MLDAYIIEKIREQREERQREGFIPARIDAPPPAPPGAHDERDDDPRDPGAVIIEFQF